MGIAAKRSELVQGLFNEGLNQLKQTPVIKCRDIDFYNHIVIKTGWTTGASGGCSNFKPTLYIGLRGNEFDKDTALRRSIKNPGRRGVWKQATDCAKQDRWLFVEYTHIHQSSDIGGFISDNPLDHIRALIAHELAHAVHWWNIETLSEEDTKSHGTAWQAIYRALRSTWVNPLIHN